MVKVKPETATSFFECSPARLRAAKVGLETISVRLALGFIKLAHQQNETVKIGLTFMAVKTCRNWSICCSRFLSSQNFWFLSL